MIKKTPEVQALFLKQSTLNVEAFQDDDDDDGEEKYADAKIEEETQKSNEPSVPEETAKPESENEETKPEEKLESVVPSWFHRNSEHNKNLHNEMSYNPLKRNPLYGGGEFCAYDELLLLKTHFHPTVAMFAEQILNGMYLI